MSILFFLNVFLFMTFNRASRSKLNKMRKPNPAG